MNKQYIRTHLTTDTSSLTYLCVVVSMLAFK